jgi:hypothetical protein
MPALATAQRTFVASYGSDANPCSIGQPCRTFAAAIAQASAGGDVVALDSAGYGPFTVDRAITIQAAPGVYAGVSAPSGAAVQVSAGASDKVVLRGLTLNGLGTGGVGIAFTGGGAEVYVENCVISNFSSAGILSFFPIHVQDTVVRDSVIGIQIDNAGTTVTATLDRVRLQGSSLWAIVSWRHARVTVRDSFATLNHVAFQAMQGGVLNIDNSVASENSTAVTSYTVPYGGGTVRIANSMVVDNTLGLEVGTGTIETWKNNQVSGNSTNVSGALTPVNPE